MAGGVIGMKSKLVFFDSKPVKRRMDKKTWKVLSTFGRFTRRRAQTSMRSGGKSGIVSDPGEPPRYHKKTLRRNIFYGFDMQSFAVVIGPIVVPTKSRAGSLALEALEEGGLTTIVGTNKKRMTVRIEERPFMGPAFEAEQSNISELWRSA